MSNNNKQPSAKQRLSAHMRDGFDCTYCGKAIAEFDDLTVDHVLPKKHGGTNEAGNLTTCCFKCNQDKGNLILTQYLRAFEIKVTEKIAKFL